MIISTCRSICSPSSERPKIIQMLSQLSKHFGVKQEHEDEGRGLGEPVAVEHLVEELHSRLPDV